MKAPAEVASASEYPRQAPVPLQCNVILVSVSLPFPLPAHTGEGINSSRGSTVCTTSQPEDKVRTPSPCIRKNLWSGLKIPPLFVRVYKVCMNWIYSSKFISNVFMWIYSNLKHKFILFKSVTLLLKRLDALDVHIYMEKVSPHLPVSNNEGFSAIPAFVKKLIFSKFKSQLDSELL